MRPCSYEVVGNMSGLVLDNLAMSRVFLGVVSIDVKRGLFNDDLLEAETNADFLRSAQRVTVVADSSKFSALGIARICDFEPIDEILTDSVDSQTLEVLDSQGITVLTV